MPFKLYLANDDFCQNVEIKFAFHTEDDIQYINTEISKPITKYFLPFLD